MVAECFPVHWDRAQREQKEKKTKEKKKHGAVPISLSVPIENIVFYLFWFWFVICFKIYYWKVGFTEKRSSVHWHAPCGHKGHS